MAALGVSLNRLRLQNPILVASGTFGYAREMTAFVDFTQLGGIVTQDGDAATASGQSAASHGRNGQWDAEFHWAGQRRI